MSCRVCFDEETDKDKFVSPCKCKGDAGNIHEKCLRQWIETSEREKCEICNTEYSKKEICSIQLRKYFNGCLSCQCNTYNSKFFIVNFIFSCFFLITNDLNNIKIITYITLAIMYTFSLIIFIKQHISGIQQLFTIDSLIIWKFSYTFSLSLTALIFILDASEQCENICLYVHKKSCDQSCPSFSNTYMKDNYIIGKILLFDYINLGLIIILRSLILCQKYNKKTVFSDYEEKKPLIE